MEFLLKSLSYFKALDELGLSPYVSYLPFITQK